LSVVGSNMARIRSSVRGRGQHSGGVIGTDGSSTSDSQKAVVVQDEPQRVRDGGGGAQAHTLCLCSCSCLHTAKQTDTHTHTHTNTHMRMHMHMLMHMDLYALAYAHAHTYIPAHKRTHALTPGYAAIVVQTANTPIPSRSGQIRQARSCICVYIYIHIYI
jgi:hypothetical protein